MIIPFGNLTTSPRVAGGIYTTVDFDNIRDNPSGTFYLMNDLDFSTFGNFTPMPGFSGTFYGQNHTIDNITIKVSGGASIFGEADGTVTVRDLRVTNADLNGYGVSSAILFTTNNYYTATEINLSNIYVHGAIEGGGHTSGLFARIDGYNNVQPTGSIEKCVVNVNIHTGGVYSGAFTGLFRYTRTTISDCCAMGEKNVSSTSSLGSFFGYLNESTNLTSRCYTVFDNGNGAGVYMSGTGSTQNGNGCYYNESTSNYGCNWTGRYAADLKLESTYSSWDFINTWKIDSNYNNGYPYLQCMADVFEV